MCNGTKSTTMLNEQIYIVVMAVAMMWRTKMATLSVFGYANGGGSGGDGDARLKNVSVAHRNPSDAKIAQRCRRRPQPLGEIHGRVGRPSKWNNENYDSTLRGDDTHKTPQHEPRWPWTRWPPMSQAVTTETGKVEFERHCRRRN